ncbi:MAG: PIN domain-containing protein [Deltaproteobacteria bacterium]|nr:PIN domain-containing protein [Deltaproteobacteria bacterium]
MNVVVDTHPLVWHLTDQPRRLSRRARRVIEDAEQAHATVHVPTIVLMEMVLLERAGRIAVGWGELRAQLSLLPGFRVEPLEAEDVEQARALAGLADPFDRMIAGTARRLGLPLLTRDAALASVVETLW